MTCLQLLLSTILRKTKVWAGCSLRVFCVLQSGENPDDLSAKVLAQQSHSHHVAHHMVIARPAIAITRQSPGNRALTTRSSRVHHAVITRSSRGHHAVITQSSRSHHAVITQ